MKNSKTVNGLNLSLSTLLTLIFVVLKLTDNIDWSWWWVFSPTLISFGLSLLIIVLIAIFMVVSEIRK